MTGPEPGCACRPPWPALVARTEAGDVAVAPAAEGGFGQEPIAQSLQGQRIGPAGPAPVQRVRGDAEEHLAGEGIVPRVQRRKLAHQAISSAS